MMKYKKFRGKSLTGEWVYSTTIEQRRDGTVKVGGIEVDPETVGQWIGIHDRTCKDIYEGDLLDYAYNVGTRECGWHRVRVEWETESLSFVGVDVWIRTLDGRPIVRRLSQCLRECIVCGNIYDDAERF